MLLTLASVPNLPAVSNRNNKKDSKDALILTKNSSSTIDVQDIKLSKKLSRLASNEHQPDANLSKNRK